VCRWTVQSAYLAGGVFLTTAMIYFVAVLSCVCFLMLFEIRDHLMYTRGIPVQVLHFQRVVEEVLGYGGRVAVLAAVVFTQAGFATAYVIFIADNLSDLYPVFDFRVYALFQIVPLVLLCWVRKLDWISPFAMGGMLAIALAVFTVVFYCINERLSVYGIPSGAVSRMDWSTFPIAFGIVVYLFEGIGLILPLESKMKNRGHFIPVMWAVHLSISTIVAAFGLIGYFSFYLCTQGPIIGNLPPEGPLFVLTIWGLNVALTFTYPIQMYPVFEIVDTVLEERLSERVFVWGSMAARALIVLLSVAVGIAIPDFSLFLSLIGGLGSAQLMFIIPPITYFVAFREELPTWKKVGCCVLLAFGIATLILTTTFTLIDMVHTFSGHQDSDDCSLGV
jgi:proton-coupled amino acid transporter